MTNVNIKTLWFGNFRWAVMKYAVGFSMESPARRKCAA